MTVSYLPSAAALNRKARKLAGSLMKEAARQRERTAAQAVVDAAARDTRVQALRAHLNASPAANAWHKWASDRMSGALADKLSDLDAACDMPGAEDAALPTVEQVERRALRSFARYLLRTAYGVPEARAAALAEYDAAKVTEVSDDSAPERAARRAAAKRAEVSALASVRQSEPECPSIDRRAAAMLAILTDPALVAALPAGIRAVAMLPDACRTANMLLPESAQVTPDAVRGE